MNKTKNLTVKCRVCKVAEYRLNETEQGVYKMIGIPTSYICPDCYAKEKNWL